MVPLVQALVQAVEAAGTLDSVAVASNLERASVTFHAQTGSMRASDHQFQQPLVVGVMDRQGAPGVKFDVEGSGYGFRVVRQITPAKAQQPHRCTMQRF